MSEARSVGIYEISDCRLQILLQIGVFGERETVHGGVGEDASVSARRVRQQDSLRVELVVRVGRDDGHMTVVIVVMQRGEPAQDASRLAVQREWPRIGERGQRLAERRLLVIP